MTSVFDQSTTPYAAALFTGATYGMTYCGAGCAPFLSTYIMGTQAGALRGLKSVAVFTAARILTLGVLGFGSGILGTALLTAKDRPQSVLFSGAMMAIGVLMCLRPARENCQSHLEGDAAKGWLMSRLTFNSTTPLWVAGAAFALVPCPPLVAMLLYSAQMQSPLASGLLLLLFGFGTAVSPLVLVAILAGCFSQKIRARVPQYRLVFQRLSGLILILLGVLSVAG